MSVKPSCYYTPGPSGTEVERDVADIQENQKGGGGSGAQDTESLYPGYAEHRRDTGGRWWRIQCDIEAFEDLGAWQAAFNRLSVNGVSPYVWVSEADNGGAPPAPYVSGRALARAAWEAVSIPAPTVETNPKVGDRGATLVGMDTWVWATGETVRSVSVTATAGATSATVTASSAGLQLSAPDGKASCEGFGVPWRRGMPEGSSPCTISFNRSSAHLGGTTPLSVKVAYSASYTASDGSSGTLPNVTATSTVDLPVAEVQTLTTNHDNPRQN